MNTQFLFVGIVFLYVSIQAVSLVINYLNVRFPRPPLDDTFEGYMDRGLYTRVLAYNREKEKFQLLEGFFSFAVTLMFLIGKGPGWLDGFLEGAIEHPLWRGFIFFGFLYVCFELIGLPFKAYFDFSLEARYGFNTKTCKIFITDEIKQLILALLLGSLVWYLFYTTLQHVGPLFPLIVGGILFGLVLLFSSLYTTLIVPLFNKLRPLEEGALKDAITALAQKTGFPLSGIYIMNASKRSRKSNAYFSGLGRFKKIVLFDTLLEHHDNEEILSILAHEIGHYRKGHMRWNLFLSALSIFISLGLLSLIIESPEISAALGAQQYGAHVNVFAFFILYSPLSVLENLLLLSISRRFEYEADAFAVRHTSKEWYRRALKKLFVENMADLYPHPLYVWFHYSHPPVLKRLEALERVPSLQEDTGEGSQRSISDRKDR